MRKDLNFQEEHQMPQFHWLFIVQKEQGIMEQLLVIAIAHLDLQLPKIEKQESTNFLQHPKELV